jgi:fluoride exporter
MSLKKTRRPIEERLMSFSICLIVMLGGALGTLARYLISLAAAPISAELPWGTILINISGSFVIGFFGTLTLAQGRYPLSDTFRLFVMTGLCGGYTTFSAFSLQTLDLMRNGAAGRAFVNVFASVIFCLAAVSVGHWIAARLNGGAVQIAQTAIEEEARLDG